MGPRKSLEEKVAVIVFVVVVIILAAVVGEAIATTADVAEVASVFKNLLDPGAVLGALNVLPH